MAVAALARPSPAAKGAGPAGPMARGRSAAPAAVALPFGGALQARMVLGPARDGFEREADTAAAHVVGGRPGLPGLSALPSGFGGGMAQRACSACGGDEDRHRRVQRKCGCGAAPGEPCSCKKEEDHPEVQIDRRAKPGTRAAPRPAAPRPADPLAADPLAAVDRVIRTPGRPLPDPVRQDMEQGFGRSFGHVRIHDTPRAAASAEGIGAQAYTVGNHIAFNRGQYQPGTDAGRFLLAHELAHTVQQSGARPVAPQAAPRISQPGDRHEAQADRAAAAAVSGGPVPGLSPGAAPISRYSLGEFGDDLWSAGEALVDTGADLIDAAGDGLGTLYDTAVAIAEAVDGAVSLDGTTLVISVPEFDPCPALAFDMQLSDLGIAPSLYFPVVAGALGIGIVEVIGVLGVEAALDPGFGFNLAGCSFGPGEIRIDPLSAASSISGMLTVEGASMVSLGGTLGGAADLMAVITWPDPPFMLAVPLVGLSVGGTFQLMMQMGGEISGKVHATAGPGGIAMANLITGQVGVAMDLAYGLSGSLRILGAELCRVGWPLDSTHMEGAAAFSIASAIGIGTDGVSMKMLVSASPMATNPLEDLGFAFDASRLQDDCPLCDFLTELGLMPGQNGHNWDNPDYQDKLPRFGGPVEGVMARDPGLKSGALCRGTCGVDCPANNCDEPADRVECVDVGDHHVWHTYTNYATCGAAQGCMDHDACYDSAAEMPIWGFGGYMFGPMYRACDLEALCGYSFKQAVTWAGGEGPYDRRLRYADSHTVTEGCLGSCPKNIAAEGEPEVQQTRVPDRKLWPGVSVGESWGKEFVNEKLFHGFVEVPYIVGVHYGVDAAARIDADARAELGPISLRNARLIYDPKTMTYRGTADLALFANVRGSARITAGLEGFLSDFLCLLNWVTLRGTMSAGITVQLPTDLSVGVDLYCAKGQLYILPRANLKTCLDIFGEITAGLDVFLLSMQVYSQEWPLIQKQIQKCWNMEFRFDPFLLGDAPRFHMLSQLLQVDTLLGELFEEDSPRNLDQTPARSPLPAAPGLLFPCLSDDPSDAPPDTPPPPPPGCTVKATGADARRIMPDRSDRAPTWTGAQTLAIPGGGSETVGTRMEAPFLENSIAREDSDLGSVQTAIYGHPGLPSLGCFKAKGPGGKARRIGEQEFVKGHLLNAEIGGPAEVKNLFPITRKANDTHKRAVEQERERVVKRVRADELVFYAVTVQNISGPTEIDDKAGNGTGFYKVDATLMCEIADYQLCTNDTLQKNPSRFVPVPSQFVFHPGGGKPFDEVTDGSLC